MTKNQVDKITKDIMDAVIFIDHYQKLNKFSPLITCIAFRLASDAVAHKYLKQEQINIVSKLSEEILTMNLKKEIH